jgi:transmembrane sensor
MTGASTARAAVPSPQVLIALHETAAGWFMRRGEPSWTGADERALNAWLQEDPLHREVFDAMATTSHDLHQIPWATSNAWRPQGRTAVAPSTAPQPAVAAPAPRGPAHRALVPQPVWGGALAAVLVAVLLGGYGWHRWDHTAAYTLEVATAPGEVRQIALPDGSSLVLNINSIAQVRYYPRRREVVLGQGEAFFEVAPDPARPFTVDSGAAQVRVLGTAFNVRAGPPQWEIQVLQGRVEVRPDRLGQPERVMVMGAGAGLAIDPATGRSRSVPADADTVGDWRSGQIHFRRTPLAEVAQQLSRYLGQPVVLEAADLARQPVSGVAATAEPQVFLQALPAFLPVRVRQLPDGSWRIAGPR